MSQPAENPKDYEPEFQPPRYPYVGQHKNGHKKLILIIAIVAAVAVLAGAAVWYFGMRTKKPVVSNSPAKTTTTATTQTPAMDPSVASVPQTFKSAKLNILVTYRKDWTLTESANKAEMILASPSTSYTRADGTSATGPFTLKIREDVPAAMQTTIQKSVAAEDSTIIGYAQFTPTQRQYTNLSFAGKTSSMFNFFMVTGDNSYKTGVPFGTGIDLSGTTYLIAGGYGADTGDALVFDAVPKASAESTIYDQALDVVKNLQIY